MAALEPRALEMDEVARVVQDFANAAANTIEAGFDGIEILGANGYLVDQFLSPVLYGRNDQYTGCVSARNIDPSEGCSCPALPQPDDVRTSLYA